ncbi:MAG: hypothetical protein J2P24_08665 [Streptosporangiales bacterium]|nr:hypothetical protein [Streptosporangiales bacterium]MBO0891609.1 hypothetical protein [Acidothermales bacterium]
MDHHAAPRGFDVQAFFAAIDERRRREGLSWSRVAAQMWELSADFNALHERYHPIAASTISGMARRGDTSCQHALVMLRWLERTPEDFIAEPRPGTAGVPLPEAGPAHFLRWDLKALYGALDESRVRRGATWRQAAQRLYCSPNQLTGLRTAKYATGMRLAMRICQALGRPSADFVHPADW